MSLRKEMWGPKFWFTLHYIGYSYPQNPTNADKQNYAQFIRSFANTLPCHDCRQHFTKLLSVHPPEKHLNNRGDFFNYTVDLHNHVNQRLNKPQLSHAHAETYLLSNSKPATTNINIIIILLAIGALVIYIFFAKKRNNPACP